MTGPLALVGSGEYLPVMLEIERALIEGRPAKYVQIPTAAAPEGAASLGRWTTLGRAQASRLGVEAVPIVARDRDEADDSTLAALVEGAGLIYLSGGNPTFLADTLRGSLLWSAIETAWRGGAALAGCSAGAMALADSVMDIRRIGRGDVVGLGAAPRLRVIPHFDKMLGRMPDLLTRPFLHSPVGGTLIGIDEDTALVGGLRDDPNIYEVQGRQSVWILGEGARREIAAGSTVSF